MMKKILDYIMLIRPSLLYPVWAFLFLGWHWAEKSTTFGFTWNLPDLFWITLISYSLILGWTYVINQIFDIETDRINDKLFLLPRGIISLRSAWIFSFSALIASFLMGIWIGRAYLMLWMISLLMGYAYSGPPFRFKDKPIWDILSNALGYGVVNFAVGWTTSADLSLRVLPHAGLYGLAVAAVFLNTTVPDIPGDRSTGKRTTGVLLGKRNTLVLSSSLFLVTLVLSLLLKDLIVAVSGLTGALFSLISIFAENDLFPKLSYRIPAGIFVLFVSLRYPPLLVLGLIIAIFMRIYYRRRFRLAYPSITGK